MPSPVLPLQLTIAAGTYDGGIASYRMELYPNEDEDDEDDDDVDRPPMANELQLFFASPVHQGSVRSLTVAKSTKSTTAAGNRDSNSNGQLLLSTGYDEMLKTHDFGKHLATSGEVRTPADFGTPYCAAFAPPYTSDQSAGDPTGSTGNTASTANSTHCLVGFGAAATSTDDGATQSTGGKLVIYKKRDWTIQHVLAGHEGGISSLAVHPTGKLALSGGQSDGKLKLWDLERGRLAFSSPTIRKSGTTATTGSSNGTKSSYESIDCIVWNQAGDCYAFCHGSHVTVRQVQTGKDLLDVDLPSKVNQVCLLQGVEGLFVAAACNDGSLPLLAVTLQGDDEERRAIMAIEPVEGPVAGEERFKCIQPVTGYYVVTANSAGVVSVMNLQGAVNMLLSDSNVDEDNDEDGNEEETELGSDNDSEENETELAVDIIDSVQLGSGARITCLTVWVSPLPVPNEPKEHTKQAHSKAPTPAPTPAPTLRKDRHDATATRVVLNEESLARARDLVSQAKKIQKRKTEKKHKLAAQRIK